VRASRVIGAVTATGSIGSLAFEQPIEFGNLLVSQHAAQLFPHFRGEFGRRRRITPCVPRRLARVALDRTESPALLFAQVEPTDDAERPLQVVQTAARTHSLTEALQNLDLLRFKDSLQFCQEVSDGVLAPRATGQLLLQFRDAGLIAGFNCLDKLFNQRLSPFFAGPLPFEFVPQLGIELVVAFGLLLAELQFGSEAPELSKRAAAGRAALGCEPFPDLRQLLTLVVTQDPLDRIEEFLETMAAAHFPELRADLGGAFAIARLLGLANLFHALAHPLPAGAGGPLLAELGGDAIELGLLVLVKLERFADALDPGLQAAGGPAFTRRVSQLNGATRPTLPPRLAHRRGHEQRND